MTGQGEPFEDTEPYMGTKSDKPPLLSRREFIRNTVRLAVAGALVPGAVATLLPAIAPDALGGGGAGPVIRRDPATNAKIPITLADLDGEPPVVVTAEWNFLPAVVYKVKKSALEGSSDKRGYNTAQFAIQHPADEDMAILVYDGKCKHLGCTVGFLANKPASADVPDYDGDGFNDGGVLCPCHQGQYDIYDLALNVPGTPPPAPLNVIEADVGGYTDETTGESFSDVILGVEKHIQNAYQEANGAGQAEALVGTGAFNIRTPGWSA